MTKDFRIWLQNISIIFFQKNIVKQVNMKDWEWEKNVRYAFGRWRRHRWRLVGNSARLCRNELFMNVLFSVLSSAALRNVQWNPTMKKKHMYTFGICCVYLQMLPLSCVHCNVQYAIIVGNTSCRYKTEMITKSGIFQSYYCAFFFFCSSSYCAS